MLICLMLMLIYIKLEVRTYWVCKNLELIKYVSCVKNRIVYLIFRFFIKNFYLNVQKNGLKLILIF